MSNINLDKYKKAVYFPIYSEVGYNILNINQLGEEINFVQAQNELTLEVVDIPIHEISTSGDLIYIK